MKPNGEFVWADQYGNKNIAAVMAWLEIKTFGDLAALTELKLKDAGLIDDEISEIKKILAKRGLRLAPPPAPPAR